MKRIRITLPRGNSQRFSNLDTLHDAIVNGLSCVGLEAQKMLGKDALPWNFTFLGGADSWARWAHTLIISTPNAEMAEAISRLRPEYLSKVRPQTGERVSFAGATITDDLLPILPGQDVMNCVALAPIVVSKQGQHPAANRFAKSVADIDLSSELNRRLSRTAGREVSLEFHPDPLYLRANPRHHRVVQLKSVPKGRIFVDGLVVPLTIRGKTEDIALAWHAGLGEKTRMGFGVIGASDRGLGR